MKFSTVLLASAVSGLSISGSLQAHHSGSVYERKPIWVQGTVVLSQPMNPHTLVTLESPRDDGRIQRWVVEGPPVRLERAVADLYIPRSGDVIGFCAFPYKPLEELQRMFPEADFSGSRHFRETDEVVTQSVAGHVMLKPDGEMQYWEPHGVLAECIRSSAESRQSWLAFIDSDARAWQAWCQQRQYAAIQEDPTLPVYVEETNALLDRPCE